MGPFFLLMKSVKRADSMDVPGGCMMKTRLLPSPSDPPASGPRPPVH